MPGQELRLGPFVGGLNLFSDPSAVADTEMVTCINYEVGIDGSLLSRPPISLHESSPPGATDNMKVLLLADLNNISYLIGSNSHGVYYSTGQGVNWVLISSTISCDCAVQYANKVWFFPKATHAAGGGTWDGTTFASLTTLPGASSAIVYKERTWIVPGVSATSNTARLQYSLTADPSSWNTGDATFIDIQPGDGKKLVDLLVYQDNIILFKEDSTYVFAFDSVPSSSSLKNVNNFIGASGFNCVVLFENSIFVFHRESIYEIINYHWTKVNIKVPPVHDTSTPSGSSYAIPYLITLFGDRLIFRYYRKVYSFGLRTRTWTEFQFTIDNNEHWFGALVRLPNSSDPVYNFDVYYAGSVLNNDIKTFYLQDGYDNVTTESDDIVCTMQTKNFDSAYGRRYRIFSFGQRYKKMHWWGADLVTSESVTGIATPVVTNFKTTWAQAKQYTWSQLNTWGQPLLVIPGTSTTWPSPGTNARHFVKFMKALRYRQINFQIIMTTDGTINTGPARLFGILNVMEVKEVVTEGSN